MSHRQCREAGRHICHQASGRRCIEDGCENAAGTLWGPLWCPEHDVERLDRITASLEDIRTSLRGDRMTTDPRVEAVMRWLWAVRQNPDGMTDDELAAEGIAIADEGDPLRIALREPSDELVERLVYPLFVHDDWSHAYDGNEIVGAKCGCGHLEPNGEAWVGHRVRAVLAVLDDEFGVTR